MLEICHCNSFADAEFL